MKRYDEIKSLLAKAGQYPELTPVGSEGRCFVCPLCDGQGDISDDFVSEGIAAHGGGIDTSIVGVQVFGIGDAMQAMEKLVPAAIHAMPELIAKADQASKIQAELDRAVELLRKAREIGPMHNATGIEVDAFLADLDRKDGA